MIITTTLLFNSPPFVPKALNPCVMAQANAAMVKYVHQTRAKRVPQTSTAAMVLIACSAQREKHLPQDLHPAMTAHQVATKMKTLLRQRPFAKYIHHVLLDVKQVLPRLTPTTEFALIAFQENIKPPTTLKE